MPDFYQAANCPICELEGELVIARTSSGRLVLVCAECGIGFFDVRDSQDPERAVEMLDEKLGPPTEHEIDAAGWRPLCRDRVTTELPSR